VIAHVLVCRAARWRPVGYSNGQTAFEHVILVAAGVALVYPALTFDLIGVGLVGIAVFSQKLLRKGT